jgi:glycerate 2-kinase
VRAGYECILLGDRIEGEARDVAAEHAALARACRRRAPRGPPVGRRTDRHDPRPRAAAAPTRNMRWPWRWRWTACPASRRSPATPTAPTAAAARPTIRPAPIDGHLARARAAGLDPANVSSPTTIPRLSSLRLGDLVSPGPTCTNVNDFRAIVVDRP